MIQTEIQLFNKEIIQAVRIFLALLYGARLRLLKFFPERDTCNTGDISDELIKRKTFVNHHPAELEDRARIIGPVEGVKTWYCLNAERIRGVKNFLYTFFYSPDLT